MQVIRGRAGKQSEKRGETFTGTVWADSVFKDADITVNNVFFEPKARTFWHRHEVGQLLIITHGAGYVASRDGEAHSVRAGDTVYFPAGEVHWHGAGPNSYMLHIAISLKNTEWLEEVSDEDYQKATQMD